MIYLEMVLTVNSMLYFFFFFYHNKKIIFRKGHQVRHLSSSPRRGIMFPASERRDLRGANWGSLTRAERLRAGGSGQVKGSMRAGPAEPPRGGCGNAELHCGHRPGDSPFQLWAAEGFELSPANARTFHSLTVKFYYDIFEEQKFK